VVAFSIVASFAISQTVTHRAGHPPSAGPMQTPHSPPKFGDPVSELTTQQATNFTLGQAQFRVIDGPADGLGPIFNAQSCNACHTQPYVNGIVTTGGASAITETRAGMHNRTKCERHRSGDCGLAVLSYMMVAPARSIQRSGSTMAKPQR
jgi:hypothetical protein